VFRMWRATVNSWRGLIAAAKSEQAFREELAVFLCAIPISFWITPSAWKRVAMLGSILLLMAVELLNTSIEKLCDHVHADQHPDIGRIKDMGSAAVGMALLLAAIVWLLIIAEWFGLA
jgi:diacylglycerol kinase (ATP)